MSLPSLSDYQAVFSNPATCLYDGVLKKCTIAKTPLGQPRVRSGGFALTYCLESGVTKWAVRCFHRESTTHDRDRRYQEIAQKLHEPTVASSGYFIEFDFQKNGVMVDGASYPIVKMAWAKGETLASFLEDNHGDAKALGNLRDSLRDLRKFLFSQHIAHGDIQPGNLMVSDGGRKVQLIDYDGMYVPSIAGLGAAEIGLPNYQHPERIKNSPWSEKLDYFPFILLDLTLTILIDDGLCWDLTQSSDEKLLFDATDFQAPYASKSIESLIKRTSHGRELRAFQAICSASFDSIPHPDAYESFSPSTSRPAPVKPETVTITYQGSFPVVRGTDYSAMRRYCGNVVEMVGRIVEVKRKFTRSGTSRPYYFLSFERWNRGVRTSFRFVVWAETLLKFEKKGIDLNARYEGRWVTMSALLDKFVNQYGIAYQMIVDNVGSLQCISEEEALFRCGGKREFTQNVVMPVAGRNGDVAPAKSNADRLRGLTGVSVSSQPRKTPSLVSVSSSTPKKVPAASAGSNAERLKQLLGQGSSTVSSPSSTVPLKTIPTLKHQPHSIPSTSSTATPTSRLSSTSPTSSVKTPASNASNGDYGCLIWIVVIVGIVILVRCCGR